MHYYFDDEITTESTNNLVEKLSMCEGEIKLYFETTGGSPEAMMFLIDYLNSIYDRLTIIITSRLCSAGTFLLTDFKGKLEINVDQTDFIIFHMVDRVNHHFRKIDGVDSSKLIKQDLKLSQDFAEKFKKKGLLTDKQLKKYFFACEI